MPRRKSVRKISALSPRKGKKDTAGVSKKKERAGGADDSAALKASLAAGNLREPLQLPRGMRDILPDEERLWRLVQERAAALSRSFGYGLIATPILENRALFARGVGDVSDIVQKEMYCFKDQGEGELCLRPEGTAAIARAYISHGMLNLPQPVKLWYLGPFFRHEKPQAGRFRQFHQWGVEVIGDAHPVLDAEAISMAMAFFSDVKMEVVLQMNSVGCPQCRPRYLEGLAQFYGPKKELLCNLCKIRLERNVLRMLDCKEAQCEILREGAPQIIDALCNDCRDHFMRVLEYLDEVDISYNLNPYLVRGLDYYTRTVFEIFPIAEDGKQKTDDGTEDGATKEEKEITNKDGEEDPSSVLRPPSPGAQSALGSGGRYDGLIEELGGRPTPAVGFAVGLERVVAHLRGAQKSGAAGAEASSHIFIAQIGEAARRKALSLWHTLRKEGPVIAVLSKDGLKAQLEIANRLQVRYAIIIGQKEVLDQTVIMRDMEAGIQEVVDFSKIVGVVKKKMSEAP